MGKTNQLGVLADVFTSDASNNVGIGGSPSGSYKLEVTGTAKVSSTLLVSGAATFSSTVNVNGATATTNLNVLGVAGTMVGTTATNQQLRITAPTTTANAGAGIRFDASSGAKEATANIGVVNNATGNTGSLVFNVYNGGADFPEQMRITSAGNVGIGTSSPAKTLDVFSSNGNATAQIKVKSTGNTSAGYFGVFSNQLYISAGGTYDSGWSIDGTNGIANIVMETSNGGSAIGFGTANSNTTATERMRIRSDGNIGIGNTGESTYRLVVTSADASDSNWGAMIINGSGNVLFRVRNDGLFHTGNASLSPYSYTTANSANANLDTGGYLGRSTASSKRYKDNIADWNGNGLETILALQPRTFNYKADYYKHPEVQMLGLIAEEVAEVSPYLAEYENENRTGQIENVKYANIVVPLIKAVQEQQIQIQNLQEQNQALKSRLDKAGL